MKIAMALFFLFPLLSSPSALADDNGTAAQQQKDFEQKQRIYGTKHPWENTMPYGTQYTPPQSGGGSADVPDATDTKSKAPSATAVKATPKIGKKNSVHKQGTKRKHSSISVGSSKATEKKESVPAKKVPVQAH